MQLTFSNYDAPGNPWYGGGGALAIHEITRRLVRRGHQVRVVTGRYPGGGLRPEYRDGVAYERAGAAWLGPKLGQLAFQFLLPSRVRRSQFDVWVESLTPPFSTACLQRSTGRPVVALTQVLAGKGMRKKYRLPFDRWERRGLRTYRLAIATSNHLKQQIAVVNPGARITVIPNGTQRELIELDPGPPGADHVLYLGRLTVDQKGLDLLLQAWAGIADQLAVPLVLAGSGAAGEEAWLRRRAKELGLEVERQLRFVGQVSGAKKSDLCRRAQFLVMPSRYEAWPLVAVEAFCYQLPMVLFGIPELLELPDEVCVKVPPFQVESLGQAMLELSRDPERRARLGRAAKRYARRFDWDDLTQQYEAFLASAI